MMSGKATVIFTAVLTCKPALVKYGLVMSGVGSGGEYGLEVFGVARQCDFKAFASFWDGSV